MVSITVIIGFPEDNPAIETYLNEVHNINITLIFDCDLYAQVMDAYLNAFEYRVEQDLPIDSIVPVASFL